MDIHKKPNSSPRRLYGIFRLACRIIVLGFLGWPMVITPRLHASEPPGLLMQVTISAADLQRYMNSRPSTLQHPEEWLAWLNNKRYYGKQSTHPPSRVLSEIKYPGNPTLSSYLSQWETPLMGPGLSQYDNDREQWTFSLWGTSDNYGALISLLNALRGIEQYLSSDQSGSIIIYDHQWEAHDADTAIILTGHNQSKLLSNPTPEQIQLAKNWFAQWRQQLAKKQSSATQGSTSHE